ncbi:hypothetical protein HPP92_023378 [Vanilla planifolia]|uniref:Vitellogenin-like protein n=1 Tax=Vanilla planifolia TaxID=51239 RepID=A0A835PTP6_VANPL|nr:hypothetical protein HPP92_023378 [Vanilla planifolia]
MEEKVKGAGIGKAEDMVEGMNCNDHPYRTNTGGICAFCLQEKLGKLVSKSSDPFFSAPPPYSSSSSSPPSFPSSHLSASASSAATRFSFASDKSNRRKKKMPTSATGSIRTLEVASVDTNTGGHVHKGSKEVALKSLRSHAEASCSPRKKSLWSFLTLSYSSPAILSSISNKRRSTSSASTLSDAATSGGDLPKIARKDEKTSRREQDEASSSAATVDTSPSGSHASASFGRRVARSRSMGCGSRSFSGDFLERISNGFSDCTLRRAESHREAKPKASVDRRDTNGNVNDDEQRIKERVKCGGIFTGLGIFSSSTFWLSASNPLEDHDRLRSIRRGGAPHGRKHWGWAFASPMWAFRPGGSGGVQSVVITSGGSHGGSNPSTLIVTDR